MADLPKRPEVPPPPPPEHRSNNPSVDLTILAVRPATANNASENPFKLPIAPPGGLDGKGAQSSDESVRRVVNQPVPNVSDAPGRRTPDARTLVNENRPDGGRPTDAQQIRTFLEKTSPAHFFGHAALELVTGIMGEGTAAAPKDAAEARAIRSESPGVGYAEQALNITLAMAPVEKLVAQGIKALGIFEGYVAKGTATTAEREILATSREVARIGDGGTVARDVSATRVAQSPGETFLPELDNVFVDQAPVKQFAKHLAQGNAGERVCAEVLATDGHRILSFKPDINGTSQGGIDIVTVVYDKALQRDVVWLVDNKALSTGTNVNKVTALVENFEKNKASIVADLGRALANPAVSKEERVLLEKAAACLRDGDYKRVVTNMNFIAADAQVARGLSQKLRQQGLEFLDIRQLIKPR